MDVGKIDDSGGSIRACGQGKPEQQIKSQRVAPGGASMAGELPEKDLIKLLKSIGLSQTEKELKMLDALLDNGFPLDRETVIKMNQALKLTNDMQQALFFLKNDMKPTKENLESLDFFKEGGELSNEIMKLQDALESMPDKALSLFASKILSGAAPLHTQAGLAKSEEAGDALKTLQHDGQAGLKMELEAEMGLAKLDMHPGKLDYIISEPKKLSMERLLEHVGPEAVQILKKDLLKGEISSEKFRKAIAGASDEDFEFLNEAKERIKLIELNPLEKSEDVRAFERFKARLRHQIEHGYGREGAGIPRVALARRHAVDIKRLSMSKAGGRPLEIDEFFDDFKARLAAAKLELSHSDSQEARKSAEIIGKLSDRITFMSQMKSAPFAQIPINIGESPYNVELHIFKDKRKKNLKSASSALVALNTLNLGKVEAYLKKEEASVSIQFRLENPEIEKLAKGSYAVLEELMKQRGIRIIACGYSSSASRFTLLDSEKDLLEVEKPSGKHITIDMRM
ncbi:MAG: flagellar hook-length control protein FliK [Clostridiales bacterium]|jgi:hypothetical protein|nr:flagellar hook-length control protein FliK [Clostridiales bacterium]